MSTITTTQLPTGWLIAERFLLTDTPTLDYINLATSKGDAMRYHIDPTTIVDFPGEYDIQDHTIISYEAGDKLHYQLILDGQSVVIMQTPALLEKESLGDVHTRICLDEACKTAIERDELEGEVIVLQA